tara:strand:- start:495 stop:1046 length:552 start_codon:yes stop_codon:yes gene_type:complete
VRFLRFILSITFFKQLAIIGLSSVLLFIFVSLSLTIYTKHNNYQIVPNFEGIQISQLPLLIENENLRYEIIDSSRFDPERAPLSVITHLPSKGSEVKENRKIYFTLNPSGYRKVTVPNLIQITKRNAESMIKSSGFEIGDYSYKNNIGKDMVLEIMFNGKIIKPGELLPRKSKIDLVLGNGNR